MIDRLVRGLIKWSRFSSGASMAVTALLMISLFGMLTGWLVTTKVTSSIELKRAPSVTQHAITTEIGRWQPHSNAQLQLLDLSAMQLHISCESTLSTDIDAKNWHVSDDGAILLKLDSLSQHDCGAKDNMRLQLTSSYWSLYRASARR